MSVVSYRYPYTTVSVLCKIPRGRKLFHPVQWTDEKYVHQTARDGRPSDVAVDVSFDRSSVVCNLGVWTATV